MTETVCVLETQIGEHFYTVRNGTRKDVVLVKLKRDKVHLRYKGREDGFTLSKAEFLKFYKVAH